MWKLFVLSNVLLLQSFLHGINCYNFLQSRRSFVKQIACSSSSTFALNILSCRLVNAESNPKNSKIAGNVLEELFLHPFPEKYPFQARDFDRLNEEDDSLFYEKPKFVEHIDSDAVKSLKRYFSESFSTILGDFDSSKPLLNVLDIGSSWTSHLPDEYNLEISPKRLQNSSLVWQFNNVVLRENPFTFPTSQSKIIHRVSGIGLNAMELEANPQLTDYVVQDLNRNPLLPFESSTYDVVVCAFTIDYLTKPKEVLCEVARVLKPGGKLLVVFSDRLYVTKAVRVWTGMGVSGKRVSALERAGIVGTHIHFASTRFVDLKARRLDPEGSGDDPGDFVYVVEAVKQ